MKRFRLLIHFYDVKNYFLGQSLITVEVDGSDPELDISAFIEAIGLLQLAAFGNLMLRFQNEDRSILQDRIAARMRPRVMQVTEIA